MLLGRITMIIDVPVAVCMAIMLMVGHGARRLKMVVLGIVRILFVHPPLHTGAF